MSVPTENDWSSINIEDPDAGYARKQFLGRSYKEALKMFQRNALHYGEDLESISGVPLNYYAPAFAEYVTSAKAAEDADGASSFLSRVLWILKETPELVSEETKKILLSASKHVASAQGFYDADVEIYGRFEKLGREIEELES